VRGSGGRRPGSLRKTNRTEHFLSQGMRLKRRFCSSSIGEIVSRALSASMVPLSRPPPCDLAPFPQSLIPQQPNAASKMFFFRAPLATNFLPSWKVHDPDRQIFSFVPAPQGPIDEDEHPSLERLNTCGRGIKTGDERDAPLCEEPRIRNFHPLGHESSPMELVARVTVQRAVRDIFIGHGLPSLISLLPLLQYQFLEYSSRRPRLSSSPYPLPPLLLKNMLQSPFLVVADSRRRSPLLRLPSSFYQ